MSAVCFPTSSLAKKPVTVVEEFSKLFDDHYPFFELRGVDWEEQKKVYAAKVNASTSDDELASILCQMIRPLDDWHTTISWSHSGLGVRRHDKGCTGGSNVPWQSKITQIQSFIYSKYLKSGGKESGAITYGIIDESTGYIDIHDMYGCASWLFGWPRETAREMDQALSTMKSVRKIIIDVRFNDGGYGACAFAFASRFADKKRLVFSMETYFKGKYKKNGDVYISPKGSVNTTAKVIVLTSRQTASSAEEFVMAMMTLPQVTIVGEPTNGIHSSIYIKKLSNGWEVGLSNQRCTLPDGKVYEYVGLPPHKLITFKGDVLEQGRDDLLEQAIAY